MSDERARIEKLRRLFATPSDRLKVGIGDDAAVLDIAGNELIATVDCAIEGIHFEKHWASLADLAARAFLAATSDVLAMAGKPVAALCALALPDTLSETEFDHLILGLQRASHKSQLPIIGGNLSASAQLSITTTVLGVPRANTALRSAARPDQMIYVTGILGSAALGLALLQARDQERAIQPDEQEFVQAWLHPHLPFEWVEQHHASMCAAIDISDGLASDLTQLCAASRVGAQISFAKIPHAARFLQICERLALDPARTLLGSGEEYQLLFTSDASIEHASVFTIGRTTHEQDIHVLDEAGHKIPLQGLGYKHFSA